MRFALLFLHGSIGGRLSVAGIVHAFPLTHLLGLRLVNVESNESFLFQHVELIEANDPFLDQSYLVTASSSWEINSSLLGLFRYESMEVKTTLGIAYAEMQPFHLAYQLATNRYLQHSFIPLVVHANTHGFFIAICLLQQLCFV